MTKEKQVLELKSILDKMLIIANKKPKDTSWSVEFQEIDDLCFNGLVDLHLEFVDKYNYFQKVCIHD